MRRRDAMVALIAGSLAPSITSSQRTPLPIVGFLCSRSPAESAHLLTAYRQGLGEAGFVEGNANVPQAILVRADEVIQ